MIKRCTLFHAEVYVSGNGLKEETVEAGSVHQIKERLDEYGQ